MNASVGHCSMLEQQISQAIQVCHTYISSCKNIRLLACWTKINRDISLFNHEPVSRAGDNWHSIAMLTYFVKIIDGTQKHSFLIRIDLRSNYETTHAAKSKKQFEQCLILHQKWETSSSEHDNISICESQRIKVFDDCTFRIALFYSLLAFICSFLLSPFLVTTRLRIVDTFTLFLFINLIGFCFIGFPLLIGEFKILPFNYQL